MKSQFTIGATALFLLCACEHTGDITEATTVLAKPFQSEAEIASCIRTVMGLEVGRWNYMGTIGQIRGKFRTYEATFVYAAAGPDTWSFKAFGGDVGGDEESAETSYTKLVGTSLISLEDSELNEEGAHNVKSCIGPDAEGRYELWQEYKVPNGNGGFTTAKNMTWYSEHGSYYAEDFITEEGRINSRRSGVTTPIDQ